MAHYAKIENNIVTEILAIDYETFLNSLEGEWIKTSYNSPVGVLPVEPLIRKHCACIGYTYDSERDAFIPPKPHASWVFVEDTCEWNPPTTAPDDGKKYTWVEATTAWVEIT